MKKIILFADDFGFSEGMNLGVIKACRKGVITDINLIVNMMTSKEAVYLHNQYCPEIPMSAHINFVQGKPISNPEEIPSLVDENGYFYRSYLWKSDDLEHSKAKGIIYPSKEDLYKETKAQILRFKELTGKMPCHFDAHSMMTEEMKKAFIQVGKEFDIHEPLDNNAKDLYEVPMHTPSGRSVLNEGIEVNDFLEDHLNLLKSEHEVNILHFHPGFIDEFIIENTSLILPRAKDLDTLCQPEIKKWIKEHFLITNIEKELPVEKC